MAIDTGEIRSTLNGLIETCKDGEEGFRSAVENAKNPDLRSLFQTYSTQRAKFASELQTEVAKIGGSPETGGSVAGAAHRGWLNVKSAITGESDAAVIAECERGEDSAKKAYGDALAMDLPSDIQSIVRRQYDQVLKAHNEVRSLQLQTQAGSA